MTSWIFPCNVKAYDPFGAFSELPSVDWRQSVRLEVGDEVFIYCSKPYQQIMFRTVVTKTYIPFEEVDTSDLKYSADGEEIDPNSKYGFARLKLIAYKDTDELRLPYLVENGLKKAPQGPLKVPPETLEYLTRYFG